MTPKATEQDLRDLRNFEAREPESLTKEEREEYLRVWSACLGQAGIHLNRMFLFSALGGLFSLLTFLAASN